MELKDTIELMSSADWKDRFIAEYLQTKIRYEKAGKNRRVTWACICMNLKNRPFCTESNCRKCNLNNMSS